MIKLTKAALAAINTPAGRRALMEALNKNESSIYRYIRLNHEKLTTAAALEVIRKETGLTDKKILVREAANVPQM